MVSLAGKRGTLNQLQNIPGRRVAGRVVNANTGLFTATVKTRVIRASMNLDAVGVDATYALAILRAGTFIPIGPHVITNGISEANEFLLEVGDILTNIGDTNSTNATADMDAYLQEQA